MPWTDEQKVQYLMRLGWTVTSESADDPEKVVVRVTELPSVIAVGARDETTAAEFWVALRATIETYLHYGDPMPLPAGVGRLPWEEPSATEPAADPAPTQRLVSVEGGSAQAVEPPPTELRSPRQLCTV